MPLVNYPSSEPEDDDDGGGSDECAATATAGLVAVHSNSSERGLKREHTAEQPVDVQRDGAQKARSEKRRITVAIPKLDSTAADAVEVSKPKNEATQVADGGSMSSFLPPPKHTKVNVPQFASLPALPTAKRPTPEDGIAPTSFIPSALKAKQQQQRPQHKTKKLLKSGVPLFSAPRSLSQSSPSSCDLTESTQNTYEPMFERKAYPGDPLPDAPPPSVSLPDSQSRYNAIMAQYGSKRERASKNDPIKIYEYSVEEQYLSNQRAKDTGEISEQMAPVRSIAPGRHHITSLLNQVNQQKDVFEETFAQHKRNKKMAGAQYGF